MQLSRKLSRKCFARVGGLALALLVVAGQLLAPASWVSQLSLVRGVGASGLSAIPLPEGTIFAVTSGNRLVSFSAVTPGALNSNVAITGLQAGENVLAIDFRPRTGQLFALGSTSRVYVLNPATGAATQVGAATLSPALNGAAFGFDFNPSVDRIRLGSDADQNLRLNPDTGAVAATDTPLAFAAGDANAAANPNIAGGAYTGNFAGSTATTLYGIDSNLDILVRQGSVGGAPNSPNGGQVSTVGALGVNTTDQVGFDIGPGDTAYASLTTAGATTSSLYSVNLTTGAATSLGQIGVADTVRGLAVVPRIETIFAVTAGNNLLQFNSGTPDAVTTRAITNLQPGENIVGIDFRPATGQLYGVSGASRLYLINTATGAATLVGSPALSPALSGAAFGVDFNPVVDRLRLVSDADQNLRVNQNNGTVAGTDTPLAFAAGDANAAANPSVVGAAYTSNAAGTTSTTLYGIDSGVDALVLQGSVGGAPNSPNGGQLTTVGALGVNTGNEVGFDIAPRSGAAFASLTTSGAAASQLYTVNLQTGAASLVGTIGGGEVVRGIAVAVNVELLIALTSDNKLAFFNSLTPQSVVRTVAVSGLQAGENLVAIDARPATGVIYALSSARRLYALDAITGGAFPVGAPFTGAPLGTAFGFDFNPVVDRIRVVTNFYENLRLHPDTGAATVDTGLAYYVFDPRAGNVPNVVAAAYTNNVPGATSTALFGIDSNLDTLVLQGAPGVSGGSPNAGGLNTVGALGVNTTDQVGFDISDCGNAYASLTTAGATSSQFYTVNLQTGAATLVGTIGAAGTVRGLAVAVGFVASALDTGFVAVNAASFQGDTIAPNELVSVFGIFQTQDGTAFAAPGATLPTSLGGVSVKINGEDARLSFVSSGQINLLVPGTVADGPATVVVTNATGQTTTQVIQVTRTAPGLFAIRSSGQPVAAAYTTKDGVNLTLVFNPDGTPRPIDVGTKASPTFLTLFGTGLRSAQAANPNDANGVAEAVTVTVQGVPATVTYAGAQPGSAGLDQINLIIPPELAGAGLVRVRVEVNGQVSNSVVINLGGTPPPVNFQTVALGQTVSGQLAADDQVQIGDFGDTFFFDSYRFRATAGTTLAIDLRAALFDPLVLLYRVNGDGSRTLVAADDDLGGLGDGFTENGNALLLHVVQQTGDYEVFVTSADSEPTGTGAYTLRLGANAIQQIAFGQTVNGTITPGDLRTSADAPLDAYYFSGNAGDVVQIAMSAAAFDPFLILNLNTGEEIDFDDNSGPGLDALISVTLPSTGVYVIVATPFETGIGGNYTLTLTRGGAPAPPAAQAEAAVRERSSERVKPRAEGAPKPRFEPGDTKFQRLSFRRVFVRQ